jgi:hypothetical protein
MRMLLADLPTTVATDQQLLTGGALPCCCRHCTCPQRTPSPLVPADGLVLLSRRQRAAVQWRLEYKQLLEAGLELLQGYQQYLQGSTVLPARAAAAVA